MSRRAYAGAGFANERPACYHPAPPPPAAAAALHPAPSAPSAARLQAGATMTSARQLLRALSDRPGELGLLLRSEYRPAKTPLHRAAATGDAELLSALLAYDPSLAQVEVEETRQFYYCRRTFPVTALVFAVAALQPAAVRALLPLSRPPPASRADEAQQGQHQRQASEGSRSSSGSHSSGSHSSGSSDGMGSSRSGGSPRPTICSFQVGLLARLLHTVTYYEDWCSGAYEHSHACWHHWPEPPEPAPPDWRQRAEDTLAALLEGPHGGLTACIPRRALL